MFERALRRGRSTIAHCELRVDLAPVLAAIWPLYVSLFHGGAAHHCRRPPFEVGMGWGAGWRADRSRSLQYPTVTLASFPVSSRSDIFFRREGGRTRYVVSTA